LCNTDTESTTLDQPLKSKLQVPGQSIPDGLLTTLPSLFAVTMLTFTVVFVETNAKENGALAYCPETSEIAVVINFEFLNESGNLMTMCHVVGLVAPTLITWKNPVDGP
jgi:hypothetical protein